MVSPLDHAPSEEEYCLITACIARNLLDKPTYTGMWQNDEQKYELTKPYAQIMSTRMKGRPLMTEHDEQNGAIGEIVNVWINEKNEWYIQAIVDQNTRAGSDAITAILHAQTNGQPIDGEENPFGEGMTLGEISLSHQNGFEVREASLVKKGARSNSTIDKIELISAAELQEIKNTEYKVDNIEVPQHFPTDAPCIRASFTNVMASYTALHNPAPPTTYANTQFAPTEAQPILNQVQQQRQELQKMMMQQQQQQQPQQPQQQQPDPDAQRAALMKQLAELDSKQKPAQMSPQQQQFNDFTNKLSNPIGANDPSNTGNVHILHTNPDDDKLMAIAGVFEGRGNMLSNAQKEEAKLKLLEVAASTKAQRDALAAKDQELAMLRKQKEELEEKVSHHESDIAKQKRQKAAMFKKLLRQTNPPLSQQESMDLDKGESEFASGQTDKAMDTFQPFLVRASAYMDASAQAAQLSMDEGQANARESNGAIQLREQMQRILNPGPMVQASYNAVRHSGMKRSNDTMMAAAASSGTGGMWKPDNTTYTVPGMAELFKQAETMDDGYIRRGDIMTVKQQRS